MRSARAHIAALSEALARVERDAPRIERWGAALAARLGSGARLLCAGNGGSAAHAQHLSADLGPQPKPDGRGGGRPGGGPGDLGADRARSEPARRRGRRGRRG